MEPIARQHFNKEFTEEKYETFVRQIQDDFPEALDFRVAETPVFVPSDLKDKLVAACESFIGVITGSDFKKKTDRAIPENERIPSENAHTSFLAIDFAVCKDADGNLSPQLIELQGFPSVFGYQVYLSELFKKYYTIEDQFHYSFGTDPEVSEHDSYISRFKKLLLGNSAPENVILLEIYPEQQKTRIDFVISKHLFGVQTICLTKLIRKGNQLFYESEGNLIRIERIYNRLIFDDLQNFEGLNEVYLNLFSTELDVTWVGHPNWFYRISKFILPFLKSPYVPETEFLSSYAGEYPADLANYVLKPLFSFAGTGVQLHINQEILSRIPDPQNYILQRKVTYEPIVKGLDGYIKSEIRMLYIWPEEESRPQLLTSLSRLSRGEMIGVRFNKDFTWVGSSACFFQKED